MPLHILLLLVIGGIAGIALLLHLMGKSQPLVMTPEDACAAWIRHYPDETVDDLILAQNGRAALVRASGGLGLIWSFGADTVARHLRGVRLIETGLYLRVVFPDYTAPMVSLRLSPTERTRWHKLIEAS